MLVHYRSRLWQACSGVLLCVAALSVAQPVRAVSISGIMIYATDDFGNPNGYESYNGVFQAQMWRTLVNPGIEWYGLGITSGLPPKSVDGAFLNFPDFSVDLPLDEGENYFTLFAEPGPLTETDEYQRFLVNVYFDGNMEDPGISVLFPRFAEPDGTTVTPARPNDDQKWGFNLQRLTSTFQSFYDDGAYRVSVLRASLLPPVRASISVDRLTSHSLTPGGVDADWIGTLVLTVEPSESFGAGGGVPAPASGSGTGTGRAAGFGGAGGVGGNPGYIPPGAVGAPGAVQGNVEPEYGRGGGGDKAPKEFWQKGGGAKTPNEEDTEAHGTPTPADGALALEEWLQAATQSPEAGGTPQSTGTPRTSPAPSTPTPQMTPATPTTAATGATTATAAVTPTRTTAPSERVEALAE
jgi:hypothetical protein